MRFQFVGLSTPSLLKLCLKDLLVGMTQSIWNFWWLRWFVGTSFLGVGNSKTKKTLLTINNYLLKHNSVTRIYICGAFNKFPDYFVQAFRIVIDSWKFSMLLLYILWEDWIIFMISASNEQLLKPDCHSWWISKMQSWCEDTLEERYAIKFCFKLGKNATETYRTLQTAFQPSCMNQASVFEWHKRFKEGRESVRYKRCGRCKEVNTPELIGQRVRVTMLRF